MKIACWFGGGKNETFVEEGMKHYQSRLKAWHTFSWMAINEMKESGTEALRHPKAWKRQLAKKKQGDYVVLLDERGKQFSSLVLAERMDIWTQTYRRLLFVVGGAYGTSSFCYEQADMVWSLSTLTFPHQLVRLLLAEQVYRSYAIIHKNSYHHT